MNSRHLFNLSAITEIVTGLALLAVPALVIELLFGGSLSFGGLTVARVLGVALLSVGVAGYESPGEDAGIAPRLGLCTYNIGAAVVFAIFGSLSTSSGILLWPAVLLHGLIGVAMLRVIGPSFRTN